MIECTVDRSYTSEGFGADLDRKRMLFFFSMVGQRLLIAFVTWCLISSVVPAPPGERPGKEEEPKSDGDEPKDVRVDADGKPVKPQLDRPIVLPKKQPELVRRPDHLDAVPLERDGHLNKQFRQEILFGETKKDDGKKPEGEAGGKKKDAMTAEEKEMILIETFHK